MSRALKALEHAPECKDVDRAKTLIEEGIADVEAYREIHSDMRAWGQAWKDAFLKANTEALHAGNCPKSFDEWWNDHKNGCPTLVLDNDEQFARAVWNAAVNAATILIAAKSRHNTILAYEGLHDTLQSLTRTNEH